jgi:NAD-dependent SIR2 family protein deacetylase
LLALLEQKRMLLRVYSQNIDGLEEVAGISPKKIVYAHGSLQWATCCKCKQKVCAADIETDILNGRVAHCQVPVAGKVRASRQPSQRSQKRPLPSDDLVCGGVLKPGVTFFGEPLHDNVRRCLESDRNKVDALIVIGTSLSV